MEPVVAWPQLSPSSSHGTPNWMDPVVAQAPPNPSRSEANDAVLG
jgi:hypothetical protein